SQWRIQMAARRRTGFGVSPRCAFGRPNAMLAKPSASRWGRAPSVSAGEDFSLLGGLQDAAQRGKDLAVLFGKADLRVGSCIRTLAADHQNRTAEQFVPHNFVEGMAFIGTFQHNELPILQTG